MTDYATPAELAEFSLPANVLSSIPSDVQSAALTNASAMADSYLASRYRLPLVSWGRDLRQAVCDIAAFLCMKRLGFRPGDADVIFVESYDAALRWLMRVASGDVTPAIVGTAPVTTGGGRVCGNEPRGW